ncbi:MAG: hypothetical protein HY822_07610 [Acidobacteria bacterium]|nr:hypothetical protein [Acidobacteriota bacterium]
MPEKLKFLKSVSALMIVVFVAVTCDPLYGARPLDQAQISFQANVQVGFKKVNNRLVPTKLKINGTAFPIVQKAGQWGANASLAQLVQAAPSLKESLDKRIAQDVIVGRLKELVASGQTGVKPGESDAVRNQRVQAAATMHTAAFNAAYQKTMSSSAFARMPRELRLIEEQAEKQAEKEGNQESEEEDDGTSFWYVLGAIILIVAALVFPVVAAVWAIAEGLTIAAVAASLGATTLASVVGSILAQAFAGIGGDKLINIQYQSALP